MPEVKPALCFIGFGEAGQAIAAGLRETSIERISAWDILFPRAEGERLKHAADSIGVRCAGSAADAVHDANIVISAVTAASSIEAVQSVAPHLAGEPFLLDINSVSPGRKKEATKLLGDTARYVDVAVIARDSLGAPSDADADRRPSRRSRRAGVGRARHARHRRRS